VKLNGFTDEPHCFFARFANCNTTRKVWNIRAVGRFALLNDYNVFHGSLNFFNPARRTALFNVPMDTSTLGCLTQ